MKKLTSLVLVALLATAACSEAFERAPGGADSTTAGSPGAGASGVPGSGGTWSGSPSPSGGTSSSPNPSPAVLELGSLPTAGEGSTLVRVLGWIETGGSVLCGGGSCLIDLVDPRDPRHRIALKVATDAGGAPSSMVALGSGYSEADLQVRTSGRAILFSGDYAWVTGDWEPTRERLVARVIEAGSAPKLTILGSTIAQLKTRKPGTLVRVTGRLATPFLLSCLGGTCNLYLEDVANSARSVRIEVRLGPPSGARPNTMRPLGDSFTSGQLRVFDLRKRVCRAGERVTVVGWAFRTDDGTPYIDPVLTITRVGA